MNTQIDVNRPLIETPRPGHCNRGERAAKGWRAQFACPTGTIGLVVGHIMAFKNSEMNRFAVETLDVQPEDQVIEIGFGHGAAVKMIAERAQKGFVAGIDLSDVMVRQASKRNRETVKTGRVELSQGSVADIPYEFARFNKAVAVNNFQFWPNPELNLDEIRRVLCEGGTIMLCLRLKDPAKMFQLAPGFTEEEIDETAALVRWVGYSDIKIHRRNGNSESVCIVARR